MRVPALAAALLLGSAVAGESESRPLFPMAEFVVQQATGPKVPFVVDMDFSRSKTFVHGKPTIIVTVVLPDGKAISFGSRPIRPGDKVHWEGKLPAKGTFILHVVNETGLSTSGGTLNGPINLNVAGNRNGDWSGVSSGPCKAPRLGTCIAIGSTF